MREAKNRLTELARRAEAGERITVTRNGKLVADIVAHRPTGGFDQEAGQRWLRERGHDMTTMRIAPDFDDPLSEDVLIDPAYWTDG